MSNAQDPVTERTRRFQFSLASLLQWIAIGGLAAALFATQVELRSVKSELATSRPLPAEEVASQFEQQTTLGPIRTKVKDVRYSQSKDSYKVEFSWNDATSKQDWWSDIELKADGYGAYYGQIRNDPFLTPLGHTNPYTVLVKSPSPLTR